MRIYSVKSTVLPDKLKTRLIRAKSAPQALAFAVKDFYVCELATQDDLIDLASNGIKAENAEEPAK